ncbi:phosphate signaling complex PhoU family protein [Sulfurospirillum barnesii]|uniref:Phosphate uptake regulator n=1 Tax=Sulfurospirillum barnesii (strain ATCC 700032 / DSM 10660 / SES-3) TaxID=760154 RepID=I3XZ73_SULBS|nr:PhoU domain-containing protein [Sulfurospirillum barnesii]AFL69247.1 phosphate uptake regulator [Sulfurospirillum barnesii SES-3]
MLQNYEERLIEIKKMLLDLGSEITMASEKTLSGMESLDATRFESAKNLLKNVENQANAIDNEIVVALALFGPEAKDLRKMVAYLKITNEMVKIAENIRSFSKRMALHLQNGLPFVSLHEYSTHLCKTAIQAVNLSISTLDISDKEALEDLYRKVKVEESKSDDLYSILEKNILSDIAKMIDQSADFIQILSTMRKLERMADRSVNIVQLMIFARVGGEMKTY